MIRTTLKPNQQQAFDKLIKKQVGALFMLMGKGKSLLILKLFEDRLLKNKVNEMWVVLPASTMKNFNGEIEKHASDELKAKIRLITVESISMSDRIFNEVFASAHSKVFLVIDESTKIKNIAALRTFRWVQISKKCTYKLIATGTPMTKFIKDLYSQFLFLSPKILGYKNYDAFKEKHLEVDRITGEIVGSTNIEYINKLIEPFTFHDLERDSVDFKIYRKTIRYVSWRETDEEYEAIKSETFRQLTNNYSDKYLIMSMLTKLQMCIVDSRRIDALIDKIKTIPKDDKIIVVCRFTDTINKLKQNYLQSASIYDGSRKELESFLCNDTNILLMNIASGGLGLNLQHANHIFFFENTFDYALRLQTEARVNRKGQTKDIYYYDFDGGFGIEAIISNCIYKKSYLLAEFKKQLEKYGEKSI